MAENLTARNARLTTATVSIDTITINGKQVTLAVYRQLRRERLVADDGTLNGEPWGIVNYNPEKCSPYDPAASDHLHIVWQKGDELRRGCETAPSHGLLRDLGPLREFALASATAKPAPYEEGCYVLDPPDWISQSHSMHRITWRTNVDGLAADLVFEQDYGTQVIIDADKHAALVERSAELRGEVGTAVEAERARRAALEARWTELQALPQLFIAI